MTGREKRYRFRCGDEEIWYSIVEAVCFITGQDPMEIDPLFDTIDPDALDSLAEADSGFVSFTMEGVDVTVYASGNVVVEDHGEPPSAREPPGGDSTLLLLAPAHSDCEDEACSSLLFDRTDEHNDVVGITFLPSAGDRVRTWAEHGSGSPANAAIVDVETEVRAAATRSTSVSETDGSVDVSRIDDATDLAAVGQTVTDRVGAWTDHDRRAAVCFHSLSDLLMNVDEADAFRFLHILIEQLAAANVTAHVHMDPIAHDERTIRTFRPLFDAVVEVDERGDWTVETDTRVEMG